MKINNDEDFICDSDVFHMESDNVTIRVKEKEHPECECGCCNEGCDPDCDYCSLKTYNSHLKPTKKIVIGLYNKKTGKRIDGYLTIAPKIKDSKWSDDLYVGSSPSRIEGFEFSEHELHQRTIKNSLEHKSRTEELRIRLNHIADTAIKGSPHGYEIEKLKLNLERKTESYERVLNELNAKNAHEFLASVAPVDELAKITVERNEWRRKAQELQSQLDRAK
jgi:hypothetical protein